MLILGGVQFVTFAQVKSEKNEIKGNFDKLNVNF